MDSLSLHYYCDFFFLLRKSSIFQTGEDLHVKHFTEKGLSEKLKYLGAFLLLSTTPPGQIRMSCQVKYKQSSD